MRIEEQYNGDFLVTDEMPFSIQTIQFAQKKIWRSDTIEVSDWPITIELNDKTGYWELWLLRPYSYVEKMSDLPELPASDG